MLYFASPSIPRPRIKGLQGPYCKKARAQKGLAEKGIGIRKLYVKRHLQKRPLGNISEFWAVFFCIHSLIH